MTFPIRSARIFADVRRLLAAHPLRLIVPALLVAGAGLAYAAFGPETWQASWAIQVRDEAIGSRDRPGKFATLDSMKTAQETVQQLAKSELVVAAALREIGPPKNWSGGEWPDATAIRDAQTAIAIESPKGTEFGKTELIFVRAKADSRDRAIAFDQALCAETDRQLQSLRRRKAESLMAELDERVSVARGDLDETTDRLAAVEAQVGGDLGELRLLNEAGAGESNLRHSVVAVKTELRQATVKRAASQKLLEMLKAAADDPTMLVAAPNQLLETLPTLRQLKDGLVAGKLRIAQATGRMTEKHPLVLSARSELNEIEGQIRLELASAIAGLEADLEISGIGIGSLEAQREDLESRMTKVATLRARYGNLARETEQRNVVLSDAIRDLVDARSQHAAASTASVLTFVGAPTTGGKALPPGRLTIAGLSILAGLLAGLGCVALTVSWQFVASEEETFEPFPRTASPESNHVALAVATAAPQAADDDSEFIRLPRALVERLTEMAERNAAIVATETLAATYETPTSEEPTSVEPSIEPAPSASSPETVAPMNETTVDRTLSETWHEIEAPESIEANREEAIAASSENASDEELEIPAEDSVDPDRLLPDAVRHRLQGGAIVNWAMFPDLDPQDFRDPSNARAWRSLANAELSDESDADELLAVEGVVAEASPESSASSARPARSERPFAHAAHARRGHGRSHSHYPAHPGQAKQFRTTVPKRKLGLRQALVTLSKRRNGRG